MSPITNVTRTLGLATLLMMVISGCHTTQSGQKKLDVTKPFTAMKDSMAVEASKPKSKLTAPEAVMATGVENLLPQGVAKAFKADVNKLFCFTKIEGASEDTTITHVWFHDGEEMANVTLNIKGSPYRTYSTKIIESHKTGDWSVKIMDAQGKLITEVPFEVSGTQVSENQ